MSNKRNLRKLLDYTHTYEASEKYDNYLEYWANRPNSLLYGATPLEYMKVGCPTIVFNMIKDEVVDVVDISVELGGTPEAA